MREIKPGDLSTKNILIFLGALAALLTIGTCVERNMSDSPRLQDRRTYNNSTYSQIVYQNNQETKPAPYRQPSPPSEPPRRAK